MERLAAMWCVSSCYTAEQHSTKDVRCTNEVVKATRTSVLGLWNGNLPDQLGTMPQQQWVAEWQLATAEQHSTKDVRCSLKMTRALAFGSRIVYTGNLPECLNLRKSRPQCGPQVTPRMTRASVFGSSGKYTPATC